MWGYNKKYIDFIIGVYSEEGKHNKQIQSLHNALNLIDNFFVSDINMSIFKGNIKYFLTNSLTILKFLGNTNEKMLIDIVDKTKEWNIVEMSLNKLTNQINGGGRRKKRRKSKRRGKSKGRNYKKKNKYSKRRRYNKRNIQKDGELCIATTVFVVVFCLWLCKKFVDNTS